MRSSIVLSEYKSRRAPEGYTASRRLNRCSYRMHGLVPGHLGVQETLSGTPARTLGAGVSGGLLVF